MKACPRIRLSALWLLGLKPSSGFMLRNTLSTLVSSTYACQISLPSTVKTPVRKA